MASKNKNLAELLDANGDVLLSNLDNVSVTPTAVSDQDNTSTGQFVLPEGTTAQRPVTSYSGAQRYNTDLGVMEYYDGSTTGFTITTGHTVESVLVFENGVCLEPTTDYTISGTTLTFTTAPLSGATLRFRYLPI